MFSFFDFAQDNRFLLQILTFVCLFQLTIAVCLLATILEIRLVL